MIHKSLITIGILFVVFCWTLVTLKEKEPNETIAALIVIGVPMYVAAIIIALIWGV